VGELAKKAFREVPGGVELRVWGKLTVARSEIVGLHGEALKIRIAAPAGEGRANETLVEFLADFLGLSRSQISIIRGEKTREKVLFLRGIKAEELAGKLP
jgi:uncharacterized protein (TIGR00251 family)